MGARVNVVKDVSTHSRPKAAGIVIKVNGNNCSVSTHSRPKAAGGTNYRCPTQDLWFQLTAARRRLVFMANPFRTQSKFQLTAARRRLGGKSDG